MPLIRFPEWRPDVSDYQGQSTLTITGVRPRGDGYGPMADSTGFSDALPAACRGAITGYKDDGTVQLFAATANRLYLLDNVGLGWTDVSKGGVAYAPDVPDDQQWQFTQFNEFIIAVKTSTPPQVFQMGTSVQFADLGGTPPQARYIATVGRFVVLTGLTANPYRIQWSGINNVAQWTSGLELSDFQDLPDGGIVRGVAGGESGHVFQDNAIRRMTFAPGADYVFLIERIAQDRGLMAPYSIVRAGDRIFYLSHEGFHVIIPGQNVPTGIGKERFDRTIINLIDRNNLQLVLGANNPRASQVFWAFKTNAGSAATYDRLLCYDYLIDRATLVPMNGEYLLQMAQPGFTLEGLDSISTNLDTLPLSLDGYSPIPGADFAQFDAAHKLAFFFGLPIEAIMETSEQGTDGQRLRIHGLRPITDAPTIYGSCSKRESTNVNANYSTETIPARNGLCPLNVSTRYSRGRLRIPAGINWTFAAGIEPVFSLEGSQ
jgi:hypothetical protein